MLYFHVKIVLCTGSVPIQWWFNKCICETVRWTKYQKCLLANEIHYKTNTEHTPESTHNEINQNQTDI